MIKDSWEYRKARMQPQTSRMELEILKRLKTDKTIREAGWRIEFQKPFCLVSTTPDFYLTKGDLRIGLYLDGEKVHRNRQVRDEELRTMLEQKKRVKPLVISYPYYSEAWEERVWGQIKEALKEN